ncbi:hypothetical protein [Amycolatopsis sp. NPDC051102]|uniref:hypothetical protein n=1 Tax=Amycolatopsis sp. NPDC051102 TaxID=3155163 RepID=UPI00343395CC
MTHDDERRLSRELSRRRFVRCSVVLAGTAALAVGGVCVAEAAEFSWPDDDLGAVLALCRAVATAPAPLPSFGEEGTPLSRATRDRLEQRLGSLAAARRAQAQQGARVLRELDAAGVDKARVIAGLGRRIQGDSGAKRLLTPVTALALSTVTTHFDAAADASAELWLDFAKHYHLRVAG